jgi:hypothetical protein
MSQRKSPRPHCGAASGKSAADGLACGSISGGIQAGHAGGAVFAGDTQPAGSAYRAFEAQRDGKALRERIDALTVERQEEVGLRGAHGQTCRLIGLVQRA